MAEILEKDLSHNRVTVDAFGVHITFVNMGKSVRMVAKFPNSFVNDRVFNEARALAKKTFKEADAPK